VGKEEIDTEIRVANLVIEVMKNPSHAEHISECVVCAELYAQVSKLVGEYQYLRSCKRVLVEIRKAGATNKSLGLALDAATAKIKEQHDL